MFRFASVKRLNRETLLLLGMVHTRIPKGTSGYCLLIVEKELRDLNGFG
jgi:hypothetical protein